MHKTLSSRKRINSRSEWELGMGLYVVAESLEVWVSDRIYVRLLDVQLGMTT